jgi:hypothetical protein
MIDSDVVPPLNVLDLTRHGKKVVGGVCFGLIRKELTPTLFEKVPERPGEYRQHGDLNIGGLIEVDATGTGWLAIHREVLESMKAPHFEFQFDPKTRNITRGEDISFCEKAKQLGYGIFVDKSIRCGHYKTVDLDWINQEVVSYMSPEKVESLLDSAIRRRVSKLQTTKQAETNLIQVS